jgi:predicted nucleic acid-binding protein
MTRYTVDAVAMSRYLVDELPDAADEVFRRAEQGVDVLEAPTVTLSEAIYTATQKSTIAGVDVDTTPNAVLRGLVNDGPIRVADSDDQDLAVFGSLIDHHTLHDALLIANHRVRGTEAIVTNDEAFAGESTLWD